MFILDTERLILRNWKDSDLMPFIELNMDSRVMEFFPNILSEDETRAMVCRIKKHIEENGFGLWAVEIKETGEFIGYVGLSTVNFKEDFTPCIEVGWRLACRFWGKGYAQESARECIKYGFNRLNLKEVFSFTSVLNTKSINVMQKIGMKYMKEFDHPNVETNNKLRRHILYVVRKEETFKTP